MATSEALHYNAMNASLLSTAEVIRWGCLSPTSSGPNDTAPGPHSAGRADEIPSNSPAHSAIYRTSTSPVPNAGTSAALLEPNSHMAGNVPAHIQGSPRHIQL